MAVEINPNRLTDGSTEPQAEQLSSFLGQRHWARWTALREYIAATYPGVFGEDWQFGGKRHGWSLRYKKSRSFCTFVPERGSFKLLIVFGAAERAAAERILADLKSHVCEDYARATTYHDGKWMLTAVDSVQVLADVKALLAIKRTPRPRGRSVA
ncbi:DUF3788 domain-containing protein [bacterium]|nr:DUF3788 domain-containing protein [bacterium]